jgi:hypothetical protein
MDDVLGAAKPPANDPANESADLSIRWVQCVICFG